MTASVWIAPKIKSLDVFRMTSFVDDAEVVYDVDSDDDDPSREIVRWLCSMHKDDYRCDHVEVVVDMYDSPEFQAKLRAEDDDNQYVLSEAEIAALEAQLDEQEALYEQLDSEHE